MYGLVGIMYVLMYFLFNYEDMKDVKGIFCYMIKGWFFSGNYLLSEGSIRDRLVYWCYGVLGMVLIFCKVV